MDLVGLSGGSVGKESASNAGEVSSIPGSGRSPGFSSLEEMATHSSILAWRIPWTEDLAGYSPWGHTHTTEAREQESMQGSGTWAVGSSGD